MLRGGGFAEGKDGGVVIEILRLRVAPLRMTWGEIIAPLVALRSKRRFPF